MKSRGAIVAKHDALKAAEDAKQGLRNEMSYDQVKQHFIVALDNYSKRWFISHRERAVDFLVSVKEAKSINDMMRLVQFEMSLFESPGKGEPYSTRKHKRPPMNGRDDFNAILSDFLPHFSRLMVQAPIMVETPTFAYIYQTLQIPPINFQMPKPSAPAIDDVAMQQSLIDQAKRLQTERDRPMLLSSALRTSSIWEELNKVGYLNESMYVPIQEAQKTLRVDAEAKSSLKR